MVYLRGLVVRMSDLDAVDAAIGKLDDVSFGDATAGGMSQHGNTPRLVHAVDDHACADRFFADERRSTDPQIAPERFVG